MAPSVMICPAATKKGMASSMSLFTVLNMSATTSTRKPSPRNCTQARVTTPRAVKSGAPMSSETPAARTMSQPVSTPFPRVLGDGEFVGAEGHGAGAQHGHRKAEETQADGEEGQGDHDLDDPQGHAHAQRRLPHLAGLDHEFRP